MYELLGSAVDKLFLPSLKFYSSSKDVYCYLLVILYSTCFVFIEFTLFTLWSYCMIVISHIELLTSSSSSSSSSTTKS